MDAMFKFLGLLVLVGVVALFVGAFLLGASCRA